MEAAFRVRNGFEAKSGSIAAPVKKGNNAIVLLVAGFLMKFSMVNENNTWRSKNSRRNAIKKVEIGSEV